jgi:FkbM family methyltransferase
MHIFSVFEQVPEIKVLDVGASDIGRTPCYQGLVDKGVASVVGFEPNEQQCLFLNEKYKHKKCRFLPYFIGDGKAALFHETNWVATGSLFPPNTALLKKFQNLSELTTPVAVHDVQTMRLDDIPEIGRIDFIKMDIQGAELTALSNAVNLLKETVVINVEVEFVELYKGQPLFADVDSYLRSQGFQFHCFDGGVAGRAFKPFMRNNDINLQINQHLWSDAIYVKDWMALEGLSEEQLIIYAVLADAVLRSPDLAHVVLQQLDAVKGSDYASRYVWAVTGAAPA